MAATNTFTAASIGEALFDRFGNREILGGAPLNVAVQLHRIAKGAGRVFLVTCAGQDDRGENLRSALRREQMSTEFVQSEATEPTGWVDVIPEKNGGHRFEIGTPAAWDFIEMNGPLGELARRIDAVCFGTLAQRSPRSRETIRRFLSLASSAIRLLDINLRPPFIDAGIVESSCLQATIVKLNEEELAHVARLLKLEKPYAEALRQRYALQAVVVTRGANGTAAYDENGFHEGAPAGFDPEDGADTVGAGDAASAGLLAALLNRRSMEEALTQANWLGAWVASRRGATPQLPALQSRATAGTIGGSPQDASD